LHFTEYKNRSTQIRDTIISTLEMKLP
jgi:hypothetical protein